MQKNVRKMSINYSPNFDTKKRSNSRVKYLVFHYTGMKNEFSAIRKLQNPKFKVSTHYLIKKNGNSNSEFSIRFHLYPGINTVQTISGKRILLQISKNKSWVFSSEKQKIDIEKSLFLGRNKALNNQCIVIYGNTNDGDVNIEWNLKKAS